MRRGRWGLGRVEANRTRKHTKKGTEYRPPNRRAFSSVLVPRSIWLLPRHHHAVSRHPGPSGKKRAHTLELETGQARLQHANPQGRRLIYTAVLQRVRGGRQSKAPVLCRIQGVGIGSGGHKTGSAAP